MCRHKLNQQRQIWNDWRMTVTAGELLFVQLSKWTLLEGKSKAQALLKFSSIQGKKKKKSGICYSSEIKSSSSGMTAIKKDNRVSDFIKRCCCGESVRGGSQKRKKRANWQTVDPFLNLIAWLYFIHYSCISVELIVEGWGITVLASR